MIDLHIFEFPLSLVLSLALVSCISIICKKPVCRHPAFRHLSLALLLISSALLAVEGSWGLGLFRHWTLAVVVVLLLLTLAGTHVSKKKLRLSFTVIAFLAMQMTWYGVNYLPSSIQSLHTYNRP